MTYTSPAHLLKGGYYRLARDGRLRSVHLTAPTPRSDDAAIYHTPLIAGDISDIALGQHAVAMYNRKYIPGLENCVRIDTPGKPLIYVIDSHRMAYFAWHEAVATGHLEPGAVLVHIDRHDDALPPGSLRGLKSHDLAKAAYATREILDDVTFIVPAVAKGLISEFWNLCSRPVRYLPLLDGEAELILTHREASDEYILGNYNANPSSIKQRLPLPDLVSGLNDPKKFTLDIDIDGFVRETYQSGLPTHEDFSQAVQLLAAMASKAGVVTLATSPGCADQRVAILGGRWENIPMKKIYLGLLFGAIAGTIDVIPMIIQKLPLSANLSAFVMWVAVGVLIATSKLKLPPILKGITIAFLVFASVGVLIGFQEAKTLVPIGIMLVILGGGLGFVIDKFGT
jgi:hypothetical protein